MLAQSWGVTDHTARVRLGLVVRTILARAKLGPVTITRLGVFYTMRRKPYRKRNRRSGAIETIRAAAILKFKPARINKRRIG